MKKVGRFISALVMIVVGVGIVYFIYSLSVEDSLEGKESITNEQLSVLKVKSDVADVEVVPSSNSSIVVEWDGLSGNTDLDINQDKDILNINLKQKKFLGIVSIGININPAKLTIYSPKDQLDSIEVVNNVGYTYIADIQTEELTVKTDVSDTKIENVIASMSVESNVGNIYIENPSGIIDVRNDVGNVDIKTETVQSDMQIETDVGNVNFSVSDVPNNTSISAISDVGSIDMFGSQKNHIIKQAEYLVDIRTDVGDINVHRK